MKRRNKNYCKQFKTMKHDLEELKACRRPPPRHVMLSDLPAEDQFKKLGMKSRNFVKTVKLIAYPAETAMANQHQNEGGPKSTTQALSDVS